MKLINLTPHDITVVTHTATSTIPKSGTVARVSQVSTIVDVINDIPISIVKFGDVVGLPDFDHDTRLIVSSMVKNAVGNTRYDLLSPGDLVRDDSGNVIGCKGLYC